MAMRIGRHGFIQDNNCSLIRNQWFYSNPTLTANALMWQVIRTCQPTWAIWHGDVKEIGQFKGGWLLLLFISLWIMTFNNEVICVLFFQSCFFFCSNIEYKGRVLCLFFHPQTAPKKQKTFHKLKEFSITSTIWSQQIYYMDKRIGTHILTIQLRRFIQFHCHRCRKSRT